MRPICQCTYLDNSAVFLGMRETTLKNFRKIRFPMQHASTGIREYNMFLNMFKRINRQEFVLVHVEHRLYWNRYYKGEKHQTNTICIICSCLVIFTRKMKIVTYVKCICSACIACIHCCMYTVHVYTACTCTACIHCSG